MIQLAYDNLRQRADLVFQNGQFQDGFDLSTAVTISLFTERRAANDDGVTDATYKGGWWADTYRGDQIGSRLWLLRRKSATAQNLVTAKGYIKEALQWLLDDGVALSITITVARGSRIDSMVFTVEIQRPGGASPWSDTWERQFNAL